jgi:hypothetical protein
VVPCFCRLEGNKVLGREIGRREVQQFIGETQKLKKLNDWNHRIQRPQHFIVVSLSSFSSKRDKGIIINCEESHPQMNQPATPPSFAVTASTMPRIFTMLVKQRRSRRRLDRAWHTDVNTNSPVYSSCLLSNVSTTRRHPYVFCGCYRDIRSTSKILQSRQ